MFHGLVIVLVSSFFLNFNLICFMYFFSLIDDSIDVNVMPKQPYSDSAILRTKSSYFNNDRQFYLQSNVTIPQDGFTLAHLNTDSSNSACILSIKSILGTIIILQIITII